MESSKKVYNLVGLALTGIGFLLFLLCPMGVLPFKPYILMGLLTMSAGVMVMVVFNASIVQKLNASNGFKWATVVSRMLVGGLFIISGLIKANDAIGFSYKLEKYFSPDALDWPSLIDYALPISILICIAEIVLGLALLVGGKMKLTSWLLMFMLIFFAWLTYYTATCNPQQDGVECVTDCGCFGDAFRDAFGRPLHPLESFWKDVVLLFLTLLIFIKQSTIKMNTDKEDLILLPGGLIVLSIISVGIFSWWFPVFFTVGLYVAYYALKKLNPKGIGPEWSTAIATFLISSIFCYYCYNYLPIRDFRPYAIGNDLNIGRMSVEELNAKKAAELGIPIDQLKEKDKLKPTQFGYMYALVDTTTGELQWLRSDEYLKPKNSKYWEGGWQVVSLDYKQILISEGYETPIPPDFAFNTLYSKLNDSQKNHPKIIAQLEEKFDPPYSEIISTWQNSTTQQTMAMYQSNPIDSIMNDSLWTKINEVDSLLYPGNNPDIEVTDWLLAEDYVFILFEYDLEHAATDVQKSINKFANSAMNEGIPFYAATSSSQEEIDKFVNKHKSPFDYYIGDEIPLKTVVRSNPGLVLLKKGVVMGKWHHNSFPNYKTVKSELIK
jgi:uncharacterized membrane protein YphA (DoxX/SURF4 family)